MTKRNYKITIHTSRMDGVHFSINDVPYPLKKATATGDKINFFTQKVEITGVRNNKYDIDDILEYKQNTLYSQMFKTLIYMFLAKGKRVNIRSIEIERSSYHKSIDIDSKRQPIQADFTISTPISTAVLSSLWEENHKGHFFRTAASHYLIALSTKDRYHRFERLWRAFEQICFWHKYHEVVPTRPRDFDALSEMRTYFETNPAGLSATIAKVQGYTIRQISRLHWKSLIQCEFPYKDVNSLNYLKDGFIAKNEDYRMLLAYKKARDIYKNEWTTHGLLADVDTLMSGYRTSRRTTDVHLLSVLLCKYCYFMRNKMFHGEVADFSFCFTNHTEDDDITDFLNDLLAIAINDLMNDYNNL